MADRLAAEALIECADGDGDFGLLPALCHRNHYAACRSAVLRRADLYMTRAREVPHA